MGRPERLADNWREGKVNFALEPVPEWTEKEVLPQWANKSSEDIMLEILQCEGKVAMKRKANQREVFIAKMGHRMLRYLKEVREGGCKVVTEADDPSLLPLHLFAGVPAVPCRTFDVVSGELVEFSLLQWLTDGWYKTHALVLHGDAGLGKTPLAMTMLAEVSSVLQVDCQWKPYYLKVGTVEALREAVSVGMVKGLCAHPL